MNYWLAGYFRSNHFAADYFAGGAGGVSGPMAGSVGLLGAGR